MRWRNPFKIGRLTRADSLEIVTAKEPRSCVQGQVLMVQGSGVQVSSDESGCVYPVRELNFARRVGIWMSHP